MKFNVTLCFYNNVSYPDIIHWEKQHAEEICFKIQNKEKYILYAMPDVQEIVLCLNLGDTHEFSKTYLDNLCCLVDWPYETQNEFEYFKCLVFSKTNLHDLIRIENVIRECFPGRENGF